MFIQVRKPQFGCSFLTSLCLKWLSLGTSSERVPFYLLSPLCVYLGLSTRAPEKKLMAWNISKHSKPPAGTQCLGHCISAQCFWAMHTKQTLFRSSLFIVQEQLSLGRPCEVIIARFSRQSYQSVLPDEFSPVKKVILYLTLVPRICFVFLMYEVYSCTVPQTPKKLAQKMNTAFQWQLLFLLGAPIDFKVKNSWREFFSSARIFPY